MPNILSYFPKDKTPREQQRDLLLLLEENWNKGDLFILEMPTGSGKSAIAITITEWLKKEHKDYSAILTPNNLLTEQYKKDYPKLAAYFGMAYYRCKEDPQRQCIVSKKASGWLCGQCEDCPNREAYIKSHRRFELPYQFPYVTNFYKYVQLKSSERLSAPRSTLIIDEAHLLIDSIKSFNTIHLWRHDFDYTKYKNRIELIAALEKTQNGYEDNHFTKFIRCLQMNPPKYVVKQTEEWYKEYNREEKYWDEELRPMLLFQPVTIKGLNNPVVTDYNKKVILMSATISSKDIEELGLAGRRVVYLKADSPIPKENRPVILEEKIKLNYSNIEEGTKQIVNRIKEIAHYHKDTKGLIHATYSQAKIIKQYLKDNPRFLFHDKNNKKEVYTQFRESDSPDILVASGMYEGIDLPYDKGRWQIVAKVPYPSLAEPAIKYQTARDEDWYQWQTIKTVLQAAGRICRAPDDYGVTYIVDGAFNNLYSNNTKLFPRWFTEAVILEEET